ncbi:MAG: hypothetical protein AB1505_17530 [Candidatus Latescibacterota bacterium]
MPVSVWPLLFLLATTASAEVTTTVRASGLAPLGGDVSAAFDQARREALRQAVEEGIGTLVTARTRVENYALIEDQVLTHTDGYVCRYQVVAHGPAGDGTYRVTVDAVVSLQRLQQHFDALRLVVEEVGKPRLLCLGHESLPPSLQDGAARSGLVAVELRQALAQISADLLQVSPPGSVPESAYGSLEGAAAAGRELEADIVIRGHATVREAPGVPIPFSGGTTLEQAGLHSAAAIVRLEALWTDSGEVLAALEGEGRGAATSPAGAAVAAVRSGVERLSGELVRRLVEDWRQRVYSARTLRLEVRAGAEQLLQFEQALTSQVSGIERLYPRRQESTMRLYDARSRHSGFELARQLASGGLPGMDVEIVHVSPNTLTLQLGAR